MQSLGLDVKVLDKDENEIDLKQNLDDGDVSFSAAENENFTNEVVNDAAGAEGYSYEGEGIELEAAENEDDVQFDEEVLFEEEFSDFAEGMENEDDYE